MSRVVLPAWVRPPTPDEPDDRIVTAAVGRDVELLGRMHRPDWRRMLREIEGPVAAVGEVEWSIVTGGNIASAAAGTGKHILQAIAAASRVFKLTKMIVSADGVTASEKPSVVELVFSDQTGAGTSSPVTPVVVGGNPGVTIGITAAKNFTAEPSNLTVFEEYQLDPNKGLLVVQEPLGREAESRVADALGIRCTVPTGGAAVNYRATMRGEP